jgi:DHA1 family bicyclomycin/chloramphenicol resistance-like MFS transporter
MDATSADQPIRRRQGNLSDRSLVVLLAAIAAAGPVSLNIYLPALPAVQAAFGASVPDVQLTLSLALLAYASGLLMYGPLADRFGRRPVLLVSLVIFLAGTFLCLIAPSLGLLIAGRCVQAFGTAAGLIVSRAIVSDLFPRERMARTIASLTMVMVIGPTVSPSIGGWLVAQFGWRSVFAVMVVVGVAILLAVWRRLPETRDTAVPTIGLREQWHAARRLLGLPAFAGLTFQGATIYTVFLVFVSTAPHVMATGLGRPPTEYGFYYLFLAGGYFLGNWVVTRFASRVGVMALMNAGVLISALSAGTTLGLFALGFEHPLWIFLPIGGVFFGQGVALPNVSASAVSLAPQNAGLASSVLAFTQQIVASICVQWIGTYPVDTALPMLTFCAIASLLAFAVLRIFMKSA